MQIRYMLLFALLLPWTGRAVAQVDDFDAFMSGSMQDFDTFISEANREYLDFMRHPWKKFQGEKPAVKRSKPEPPKAPVFDPQSSKGNDKPKQLTIREILDLTTTEGEQGGVADATPVFELPGQPKPKVPATPVIKVIRDTIKDETTPPHSPVKPVIQRPTTPVKDKPVKDQPVKDQPAQGKPVQDKPAQDKPTRTKPSQGQPVSPAVPTVKPAVSKPKGPLYEGGAGRRRISFYGCDYYINDGLRGAITLGGVDEKSMTSAFETLFTSDYKPLLSDLRTLRQNDLCNDWALYLFIKQVSEAFVGRNESIVLRQFLLNSLGYRARVARNADGRLSLLMATSVPLYGCIFVTDGGVEFYDLESSKPGALYMCAKESPDAKVRMDMRMKQMPRMADKREASTRTAANLNVTVHTTVPTQRMAFYKSLPQCDYSVYATAQVDTEFSESTLAALRSAIDGKDEKEAANILLGFCQFGFDYATDPEQFGYEKPFFVEELFHYPKCDCEDRSMLYRYLVKSLLHLDVVLLDYPGHIATAVRFSRDYPGDYVVVNGSKYLVCDPTYIGASIGMAMPAFQNDEANILKY